MPPQKHNDFAAAAFCFAENTAPAYKILTPRPLAELKILAQRLDNVEVNYDQALQKLSKKPSLYTGLLTSDYPDCGGHVDAFDNVPDMTLVSSPKLGSMPHLTELDACNFDDFNLDDIDYSHNSRVVEIECDKCKTLTINVNGLCDICEILSGGAFPESGSPQQLDPIVMNHHSQDKQEGFNLCTQLSASVPTPVPDQNFCRPHIPRSMTQNTYEFESVLNLDKSEAFGENKSSTFDNCGSVTESAFSACLLTQAQDSTLERTEEPCKKQRRSTDCSVMTSFFKTMDLSSTPSSPKPSFFTPTLSRRTLSASTPKKPRWKKFDVKLEMIRAENRLNRLNSENKQAVVN